MATTIMISTSVKPALREVLMFILTLFTFRFGGVNSVTSGFIYYYVFVHSIACHLPRNGTLATGMPAVYYNW